MSDSNRLSDFPPDRFNIVASCNACGHSGAVDRDKLSGEMTISELRSRLRCGDCGDTSVEVRIIYTAAGGYSHA